MPLFNPDKIARLVSEMRKAICRLKSLKVIDKNSFLNDPDKISSAKYNFIVAIESAIDICNHIISQNGYRAPDDYADTFQVLGEQNAFGKNFVKDLKEMAKFRNRLVHLYWEVDEEQVYELLQTRLNDFKIFLDNIAIFLRLDKP
ncbi:MAG: type VII toxin-antitoxin system HepT family RNase toxin [Thermodesulfovibrionales bacterium]